MSGAGRDAVRPEGTGRARGTRAVLVAGLVVALLLAWVVSWYASSAPDGLERVAEDHGFIGTARDSHVSGSPLADYGTEGVSDERLSGGIAGVAGVVVTLLLAGGLFTAIRRRPAASVPASPAAPASPPTE